MSVVIASDITLNRQANDEQRSATHHRDVYLVKKQQVANKTIIIRNQLMAGRQVGMQADK